MWSYDFSKIDPEKHKERIIINTINYGDWKQWQWLFNYYGKKQLKKIIPEIPKSEFRNFKALFVASLILGIYKMKYENRGIKIQAERGLARA
ncbi:hypothetical protein FJ208_00585 [Candidatus Gribaldobacteria bacterium]|nr:hypothetical protein [Candidatus Gribaldobacteria bacterium]